jgi:hypothetical protein
MVGAAGFEPATSQAAKVCMPTLKTAADVSRCHRVSVWQPEAMAALIREPQAGKGKSEKNERIVAGAECQPDLGHVQRARQRKDSHRKGTGSAVSHEPAAHPR